MQAIHDAVPQVLVSQQEREWQVQTSDQGLSEMPYGQVRFSLTNGAQYTYTDCGGPLHSGLMEKDEWDNLGLQGVDEPLPSGTAAKVKAEMPKHA
jgi:hypothetical protein